MPVLLLAGCQASPPQLLEEVRLTMGTEVRITAGGADQVALRQAINAAYKEIERLSRLMSHYNPDSEVSGVNRAAGRQAVKVSPELFAVLTQAKRASRRSNGAFDATIGAIRGWRFDRQQPAMPTRERIRQQQALVDYRQLRLDAATTTAYLERSGMSLDLGGIAKLYILDRAARVLQKRGVPRAMVNGGGDIVVFAADSSPLWQIGIRDPRTTGLFASVSLRNGVIASSGDYERYFDAGNRRYHHILDPRDGYPTRGTRQVTLIAADYRQINGMSLAIMVRGPKWGRRFVGSASAVSGIIIDAQGRAWISPDLQTRLQCRSAACRRAQQPLSVDVAP